MLGELEESVDGGDNDGDALEEGVVGVVEPPGRCCGERAEGGEDCEEVSGSR